MSKIDDAAAATDRIQDHVDNAFDALRSAQVNGFGVYADTSTRYRDLITAGDEIAAAIDTMKATDWPTNADYDAAEQSAA